MVLGISCLGVPYFSLALQCYNAFYTMCLCVIYTQVLLIKIAVIRLHSAPSSMGSSYIDYIYNDTISR